MNLIRTIICISLIYGATIVIPNNVVCQNSNDRLLARRLQSVNIEGGNLSEILSRIAHRYKIPIGFEGLYYDLGTCELKSNVSLEYADVSILNLMNSLISASENCKYEVSNGVINFSSSERYFSVTDINLEDFDISGGTNKQEIKLKIAAATKTRTWQKNGGIELTTFLSGNGDSAPLPLPFQMSNSTISLRELLNRIAKETGSYYWTVSNWEKDKSLVFFSF